MILADKRDYKNGYKKHFSAYKKLAEKNSNVLSRSLLLAYSVECGLKYKLLDKWSVNSLSQIKEIIQDKNHPKHNILGTHDLQKIIKELGQEGQFKFSQIRTVHKDIVNIETYHQMQRYGIKEDANQQNSCKFEKTLKKVAEWIEEDI